MKLARRHWTSKPQSIGWLGHTEERRTVTLVGGIISQDEVRQVSVHAAWWRGGCRHVVLDVQTRRRIERPCPDCQPPEGML